MWATREGERRTWAKPGYGGRKREKRGSQFCFADEYQRYQIIGRSVLYLGVHQDSQALDTLGLQGFVQIVGFTRPLLDCRLVQDCFQRAESSAVQKLSNP